MQLAILAWLWSHSDPRVVKALAEAKLTLIQCNQALSLLGGLAGLHSVTLDTIHGDVTVSAEQRAEIVSNPNEINILSLVPATFVLSPEIKRVTLDIAGREPATFARTEFMDMQANALHTPVLLSLSTTKWLVASGGRWFEQDEAVYVTIQLAKFAIDGLGLLVTQQPYDPKNVQHAVDSWKTVKARLDEVLPMGQRGDLTKQVVGQLDAFCESIMGLAKNRALGRSAEAQRYASQAVAALNSIDDIRQRALTLLDAS